MIWLSESAASLLSLPGSGSRTVLKASRARNFASPKAPEKFRQQFHVSSDKNLPSGWPFSHPGTYRSEGPAHALSSQHRQIGPVTHAGYKHRKHI